jgi:hypothetical protein
VFPPDGAELAVHSAPDRIDILELKNYTVARSVAVPAAAKLALSWTGESVSASAPAQSAASQQAWPFGSSQIQLEGTHSLRIGTGLQHTFPMAIALVASDAASDRIFVALRDPEGSVHIRKGDFTPQRIIRLGQSPARLLPVQNGSILMAELRGGRSVQVWNTGSGKIVKRLAGPWWAVSSDGRYIAARNDSTDKPAFRVWNVGWRMP